MKASDLPPLQWFFVLKIVRESGPDGLRPHALETDLGEPKYAVSRLVDRLAHAGLIERRKDPDDRRAQRLVLSDAGVRMRTRMWPVFSGTVVRHLETPLTGEDIETLARLLEELTGTGRDQP